MKKDKWQLLHDSQLDENTVRMYERRIRSDEQLPAVVLRDDNGRYQVIDGFHRLEAMRRCGIDEISGVYVVKIPAETVPELRRKLNQHLRGCNGQKCDCVSKRLSESFQQTDTFEIPIAGSSLERLEPNCFLVLDNPSYGRWHGRNA